MTRILPFRRAVQAQPLPAAARGAVAPSPATARHHARGFTLVELMVTLAVAGILMLIAIPSFRNITLKHRLTTTANEYVNALNTARMEAVKRNSYAQFCSDSASSNTSDTLGTKCGSGGGAVTLLDAPASASTVKSPVTSVVSPMQLSGSIRAVRFNGEGIAYVPGTTTLIDDATPVIDICTKKLSADNHRVIKITTGTIVTTTTTSGNCP